MQFPYLLIKRSELAAKEASALKFMRQVIEAGNDLSAARDSARGSEIDSSRVIAQLNDRLAQSNERSALQGAMLAEKQREIAGLRAQLAEAEQKLKAERAEGTEDRHKLLDWIAKGTGGPPIYAEPETVPAEPEAPKKDPASERILGEVEEAARRVGRKPRAIVNSITAKRDADFEATMAGAGVKRIFDEDRADAETEAAVIAGEKKTA